MANPRSLGWRFFLAVLLPVLAANSLPAQNYLAVEHKGQMYVVQNVYNGFAYIREGDKLVSVKKARVALVPAPEFLPAFVTVRDLKVSSSYVALSDSGADINNEFHLRANFSSQYALKDAFLAIELHTQEGKPQIYFQEIGTITPDTPRAVEAHLKLGYKLGEGKFQLHVFTEGREVFHSEQPWQFREGAIDKMVAKRIAGKTEANPAPYVGPTPEYPKQFIKTKTAGTARVRVHLTRNGVVTNPVIEKASDPAFGAAALEAVRQWRFLPKVKDGQAVETDAIMPFTFEAPVETAKN